MMRVRVGIAGLADRGRFATAFLFLLLFAQLGWAADADPPPLVQMAEEALGDHGPGAPPIATSTAITVTAVVPANGAVDVPVSTNVTLVRFIVQFLSIRGSRKQV